MELLADLLLSSIAARALALPFAAWPVPLLSFSWQNPGARSGDCP